MPGNGDHHRTRSSPTPLVAINALREPTPSSRPEPTEEERPGILVNNYRRRQAPWPAEEEAITDEESLSDEGDDYNPQPLIRAPPGWSTPDGWLPAELYGRVQERIRQAQGRSLRYLVEVGVNRYRIQVSRNGTYVVIRLHPVRGGDRV